MFDRGIKYNISESQMLEQETELTFKTVDFEVIRVLTSNEAVMINGDYAHVVYTFSYDKLITIEYKIDVTYPKTQIEDIPAYQVYDKYKELLTNIYGAPAENDFQEDDYFETYNLQWSKDVITPRIYVIQTVYSAEYFAYPSEIEDYVEISFRYHENLEE